MTRVETRIEKAKRGNTRYEVWPLNVLKLVCVSPMGHSESGPGSLLHIDQFIPRHVGQPDAPSKPPKTFYL